MSILSSKSFLCCCIAIVFTVKGSFSSYNSVSFFAILKSASVSCLSSSGISLVPAGILAYSFSISFCFSFMSLSSLYLFKYYGTFPKFFGFSSTDFATSRFFVSTTLLFWMWFFDASYIIFAFDKARVDFVLLLGADPFRLFIGGNFSFVSSYRGGLPRARGGFYCYSYWANTRSAATLGAFGLLSG